MVRYLRDLAYERHEGFLPTVERSGDLVLGINESWHCLTVAQIDLEHDDQPQVVRLSKLQALALVQPLMDFVDPDRTMWRRADTVKLALPLELAAVAAREAAKAASDAQAGSPYPSTGDPTRAV